MNPTDPEQTASVLIDGIKRSTPLRDQALQHVDDAHQAQQAALAFEANRVASRYGADSAQSAAISARIAAHTARGGIVASERQRAQMQTPQPLPDALTIYGRVMDARGAALKAIEISAIGANGASVAAAKSAGDGSFELAVPTTIPAVPPKKGKESAAASGTGEATTDKAAKPLTSVRLVFADRRSGTVYRDPEVFTVKGGALAYRDITMEIPAKRGA